MRQILAPPSRSVGVLVNGAAPATRDSFTHTSVAESRPHILINPTTRLTLSCRREFVVGLTPRAPSSHCVLVPHGNGNSNGVVGDAGCTRIVGSARELGGMQNSASSFVLALAFSIGIRYSTSCVRCVGTIFRAHGEGKLMCVDGGGGSGGGCTVESSIMLSRTIGSGVDGTGDRGFFYSVATAGLWRHQGMTRPNASNRVVP